MFEGEGWQLGVGLLASLGARARSVKHVRLRWLRLVRTRIAERGGDMGLLVS